MKKKNFTKGTAFLKTIGEVKNTRCSNVVKNWKPAPSSQSTLCEIIIKSDKISRVEFSSYLMV